MPVMSGDISYTKIKEYLAENELPRIPCIAMTAYVEPEYRERMLDLVGVDCFLNKPLIRNELKKIVENILAGKPAVKAD